MNIKFAHLSHLGPRSSLIINQGLVQLEHNFDVDKSYRINGIIVKPRCLDLLRNIHQYDLIFCGNPIYKDFLNQSNLWKKIIWYDYGDLATLDDECLTKSIAYFKRSLVTENRSIMKYSSKVFHLDYCVLEEYLNDNNSERSIDVACLFEKDVGGRRSILVQKLTNSNFENSIIGKTTSYGSEGRNSINKYNNENYKNYLQILGDSKIIFTAFPQNHDGDSRTWEAFASGALVFRDVTFIKTKNEPKDGVHFFCFDSSKPKSISLAIEKAITFLNNDAERNLIATACLEIMKSHHMAKNRVDYMIKTTLLRI